MTMIPHNHEELITALLRRHNQQLAAWCDQFSTPAERYAALRALAESLQGCHSDPEGRLAAWASDLIQQALAR